MTASEQASLERLERRLFGDDGQGGSVGEIKRQLAVLMEDKVVRDALREQQKGRDNTRLATASIVGGLIASAMTPIVAHVLGLL
jgi:hypothetical protein